MNSPTHSEESGGQDHDSDRASGPGPIQGHGHTHGHGHGHSHSFDEGHGGSWNDVTRSRPLLATAIMLALAFVATAVGLVSLWPDGSGQQAAVQRAAELGLGTERIDAVVTATSDGTCSYSNDDAPQLCRDLTFVLQEGSEAGATVALTDLPLGQGVQTPDLAVGDAVVLGFEPQTNFYFYADRDRGSTLVWLTLLFAAVVVALGRRRGVRALLAMAITVMVLVGFVARSVLDGHDPLLVAVVAASIIAFVSLFLTHGFTPTTAVALVGTLSALGLTLVLSRVFFAFAQFTGLASEEGNTLPFVADIDLVSLLLGGAVLGALGALDDVTVTQVATVAELRYRSPNLSRAELIASGIRVGREHIASTVNTLLLAYAGASMPLLLLFALSNQSLASVANSELVAVEIVRTLCGSIGLVAAVPITTALAALLVARPAPSDEPAPVTAEPDPPPQNRTDQSLTSGGQGVDGTVPGRDLDGAAAPSWDQFGPRSDSADW